MSSKQLLIIVSLFFTSILFGQNTEKLKADVKEYSARLKEDSTDYQSRYLRGKVYVSLKKHFNALRDFDTLVTHDTTYFYAFFDSGSVLKYLDQPKAVVEDSSKAIILKPFQSYYFTQPAYDNLLYGLYTEAIALCNRALTLDSLDEEALEYRGYSYFNSGAYEDALLDFRKMYELDSTNLYALNNIGGVLANTERREESLPYYYKVLAADSTFPDIYFNLGNTYHYLGQLDSAIKYLDYALEEDPWRPETYNVLGNSYLYGNQFSKAKENYRKALELDSSDCRFYGNMGLAYYHSGSPDSALIFLNEAISRDSLLYYQFYDTRGRVYSELQQFELSNKDYLRSIEISHDAIANYGSLGWNYYLMGDYDQSIIYSTIAVENDPEAYYAKYNIALAKLCLGEMEEAYGLYYGLIKKAPDEATISAKNDLVDLKKSGGAHRKNARKMLRKVF